MLSIRTAAVAGSFYPSDKRQLEADIARYLSGPELAEVNDGHAPLALIVPHAGYIYSGQVAAAAYARLSPHKDRIQKVFLIGPSHYVWLSGVAAPACQAFETPLGTVPLDTEMIRKMADLSLVMICDEPHVCEHALEVQIPFLQTALSQFRLIPLVTGEPSEEEVGAALAYALEVPASLIVVSTDLSHFHEYMEAQAIDLMTARAIERCDASEIGPDQACGHAALSGLLWLARKQGLRINRLAMENSGDHAAPTGRVVGYGSWMVCRE